MPSLTKTVPLAVPQMRRSFVSLSVKRSRGDPSQFSCQTPSCGWLAVIVYPDEGLVFSSKAVALAERIAHPFSLVIALLWNAILHLDRGAPTSALEWLRAAEE